ncbi:MAG: xanthine dehydrogenase family protein subunit M [Silicimonas sp.]|nr:xanthine dehydrogenase family protein subunit M [Silicimonas sp.]
MRTERPVIVAGGTDFFPARGRAQITEPILDITRVTALRGLEWKDDWLRIGAASTWSDVIRADLPPAFDALKAAAREVGSVQIQNAGTVAGNLCNASPAADGVPPLMTLDAEVELASSDGPRRVPLEQFLKGPRQTDLQAGEMLVALHMPRPPAHAASAFEKLGARKYLVISIAMTAVVVGVRDGLIDHARVAVGSCAPKAVRLRQLEADLIGTAPGALAITPDHLAELTPITDVRADATYRLEAVPHQITRAIMAACDG